MTSVHIHNEFGVWEDAVEILKEALHYFLSVSPYDKRIIFVSVAMCQVPGHQPYGLL
jgi:hypothetical protein